MKFFRLMGMSFVGIWGMCASINSQTVIQVDAIINSGPQRVVYQQLAQRFQERNPSIKVKIHPRDSNRHKKLMDIWEAQGTASADIVSWYAGNRMMRFIRPDLVEPITDLWAEYQLDDEFTPAMKDLVSYENEIYAIPFGYYQWGFYYTNALFQRLGLEPPTTWKELLAICETLKANQVYCFTIGAKDAWTVGGWFDYLNLRINGLEFHLDLMQGRLSFDQPKVQKVFQTWKDLLDKGYFQPKMANRDWKEPLPFMYRERVGMMLTGNFVTTVIPEAQLRKFGFFRFPQIDPKIPYYEEAPTDVYMIPKSSPNKEAAKAFLAFLAEAKSQVFLNQALNLIAPNKNAEPSENEFIRVGTQTLQSAHGYSQYLDRDMEKEMADPALNAIVEFLKNPHVGQVVHRLEALRTRVYPDENK